MKSELTDEFIGHILDLWIVFLDCDVSYPQIQDTTFL